MYVCGPGAISSVVESCALDSDSRFRAQTPTHRIRPLTKTPLTKSQTSKMSVPESEASRSPGREGTAQRVPSSSDLGEEVQSTPASSAQSQQNVSPAKSTLPTLPDDPSKSYGVTLQMLAHGLEGGKRTDGTNHGDSLSRLGANVISNEELEEQSIADVSSSQQKNLQTKT